MVNQANACVRTTSRTKKLIEKSLATSNMAGNRLHLQNVTRKGGGGGDVRTKAGTSQPVQPFALGCPILGRADTGMRSLISLLQRGVVGDGLAQVDQGHVRCVCGFRCARARDSQCIGNSDKRHTTQIGALRSKPMLTLRTRLAGNAGRGALDTTCGPAGRRNMVQLQVVIKLYICLS